MKTFTRSFFLLPALMAGLGLMPAGRASAQGFTNLHSFTYGNDGAFPYGGVILSGNTLYGVTEEGGNGRYGTVFAYTNGGGYSTLHSFSYNSDGGYPIGSLVLSGNTLYGTTLEGGANGDGTVFALNTDGSGFRTLYSFSAGSDNASGYYVNSDGAYPEAGLVLSGNTLYGTTVEGGTSGEGTVFALNTDGSGFTNLYDFTGGSDGGYPYTGLVLSGNTLYGTTVVGGTKNAGTVFAINTNSSNFRILHSFIYASDGEEPEGGLILAGNTWNWNFGDGSTSTAQNPSHTYTRAGTYSPSLVATNSNGVAVPGFGPSITVAPPTVTFTASPTSGATPLTVSFASGNVDSASGPIAHWNWTFGDGSTSTAQNPTHTYYVPGVFHPVLTAADNLGGTVTGAGPASITATNVPGYLAYLGLVLNGGFETGDFTGWTISGAVSNTLNLFVDNGTQSGLIPQAGQFLAALGPVGSLSYLSQTLATKAGTATICFRCGWTARMANPQ
jgi:uncharacterized repeat protein (TIGR03803 family)